MRADFDAPPNIERRTQAGVCIGCGAVLGSGLITNS
jgi:hypothetical protein